MISAVVVNWNSGALLERCIRSLQEHAPACEIILVDNASEDSSLAFLAQLKPPTGVVRNTRNEGFAAANNQGWRASRGKFILFLNPDTESMPEAVAIMARRLELEPDIWAVGGRLMDTEGRNQAGFNVRAFPDIGAVAAEMLLMDEIWPRNPWSRRYRMADHDPETSCDVDQPAGACLMVRRAALESLGGFDEIFYPAWFEDVDLCKRIHDAGGRIVYEPAARFLHRGGVSLRSLKMESFLQYFHGNQLRYFQKHHGAHVTARVRRLIAAGLYLRSGLAFLRMSGRRHPDPQARAYWKAARTFAHAREASL
jgi:N-acetylglucosaminyl-diphospho-decaprenol L-rhamnosyltransferase